MSKRAYQEQLEAQLAEWDARLDLIKAKAIRITRRGQDRI